jgi:hypothetical protein
MYRLSGKYHEYWGNEQFNGHKRKRIYAKEIVAEKNTFSYFREKVKKYHRVFIRWLFM